MLHALANFTNCRGNRLGIVTVGINVEKHRSKRIFAHFLACILGASNNVEVDMNTMLSPELWEERYALKKAVSWS